VQHVEKPTKKQRIHQRRNYKRKQETTIYYNTEKIVPTKTTIDNKVVTTELQIPTIIRTPTETTISTQTTSSMTELAHEIKTMKTQIVKLENKQNNQLVSLKEEMVEKINEQETRIIEKVNNEMDQREQRNLTIFSSTIEKMLIAQTKPLQDNKQQLCEMMRNMQYKHNNDTEEPRKSIVTKRIRTSTKMKNAHTEMSDLLLTQESMPPNINATGTATPVDSRQSRHESSVSATLL
jgi:hypothetical protein